MHAAALDLELHGNTTWPLDSCGSKHTHGESHISWRRFTRQIRCLCAVRGGYIQTVCTHGLGACPATHPMPALFEGVAPWVLELLQHVLTLMAQPVSRCVAALLSRVVPSAFRETVECGGVGSGHCLSTASLTQAGDQTVWISQTCCVAGLMDMKQLDFST